ncbi:hypothetical protein SBRCBS47491_004180 [Sporothrix bragantina]|uniref:BTB domain-containing protein n=1 Tax=Sporothrix bragantina TaxID=671064 RepID=A0ABP0BLL6_9PEZI
MSQWLLETGEYSDFMIECQGQTFKAHRAVVCPQSSIIDALLKKDLEETQTSTVHIDGFSVEAVQCLLRFIYGVPRPLNVPVNTILDPMAASSTKEFQFKTTGQSQIQVAPTAEDDKKNRLVFLVWANAIADSYKVQGLCKLTCDKIKSLLENEWAPEIFLKVAQVVPIATGDMAVHHLFAQVAAEHVEDLAKHENGLSGLLALDGFFTLFLKHSAARVAELKKTANNQANQAQTLSTKVMACIKKLNDTKKCRHCAVKFDCYIETSLSTLRCAACQTRHPCT